MLGAWQPFFCQRTDTSRTISYVSKTERFILAITVGTVLARNLLFRGLSPATLEQIARLCIRRSYPRDAVIFSQSDPGDALFGVVTGRVRISASSAGGREVFLNIMEPGDTFGEIALLDGRSRTASASATAPSDLLIIRREQFLSLLAHEPVLTEHLLRLLCSRLRWVSGFAEESALLPVPGRLARPSVARPSARTREGHGHRAQGVTRRDGALPRFVPPDRQSPLAELEGAAMGGPGARQDRYSR